MILAAGRGTRLRPLTDRIPKALVEVGGVTLLERVARRLIGAGADRLIVNVHHHADRIERFVRERSGFGVDVLFSREEARPLETGGGLLRARGLFEGEGPFLLHNVDILTDLDLERLLRVQREAEGEPRGRLATLAVSGRRTSRPLLIDEEGLLGRANRTEGWEVVARGPAGTAREVGFAGVHACSRRLLESIEERGAFSIIDVYLRLVAAGERVGVHDIGEAAWSDIGTPERLARARERFAAET